MVNKIQMFKTIMTELGPMKESLRTGTKIFQCGGSKVVMPGPNTKLGKLGFESVTGFKAGSFPPSTEKYLSFSFKRNPVSVMDGITTVGTPPLTTKEAKEYLKVVEALKAEEANILKHLENIA